MSMHEIEALVECSVAVLASADPVPADARDLCYSLYEMQDQFDCGYTVLRVSEELERLGYLYLLPPDRLPEPERTEAAALNGHEGFIGEDPQIFFDADAGCACVTAGSPLWEKLCHAGQFTGADAEPVRLLPPVEVAQRIAELTCAKSDRSAAQALGYWYALFPAFLAMDWDGEDEALSPPVQALRDRLATPEALAFAAGWRLLPDPEELGSLEEYESFERQWLEPYAARIAARREEDALEAEYQRIVKAIEENRFSQALEISEALHSETDRLYYRALTSLSCHRLRIVSAEEAPAMPDGILSLEEAEKTFASLLGQRAEQDSICHINRFLCLVLLGDCQQGFQALSDAFLPQLEQLRQEAEDDWQKRFGEAVIAVLFYRILYESIPGCPPDKPRLLQTRAGTLPTPEEAEKMFHALAEEQPENAWVCRYHAGLCRMVQGDLDGTIRELRQADRMHPGDPEIQKALEQVLQMQGGVVQ